MFRARTMVLPAMLASDLNDLAAPHEGAHAARLPQLSGCYQNNSHAGLSARLVASADRVEHRVHRPRCLATEAGGDVAVRVERQSDGAVAKKVLDKLGVGSGLNQDGCGGVSEIVDPNSRQTGTLQRHLQRIRHRARFLRLAELAREDQLTPAPHPLLPER